MKQTIVVNEALRLPRGKLAAQVAHAALDAFLRAPPEDRDAWLGEGMPKVVLAVFTPEALLDVARLAAEAGLPTALIRDAGRTVVAAGTPTCVGLGPAAADRIDAITRDLRLVK